MANVLPVRLSVECQRCDNTLIVEGPINGLSNMGKRLKDAIAANKWHTMSVGKHVVGVVCDDCAVTEYGLPDDTD